MHRMRRALLDRDVSAGDAERLRSRTLGLMLEDTALELGAMALSPLSKTEYALAAPALCGGYQATLRPLAMCTCRRLSLWRVCATARLPWCPKSS